MRRKITPTQAYWNELNLERIDSIRQQIHDRSEFAGWLKTKCKKIDVETRTYLLAETQKQIEELKQWKMELLKN